MDLITQYGAAGVAIFVSALIILNMNTRVREVTERQSRSDLCTFRLGLTLVRQGVLTIDDIESAGVVRCLEKTTAPDSTLVDTLKDLL